MANETISLTVRSIDGKNLAAATTTLFVVERMGAIQANQNTNTTATVTEAGDTANQLSAWVINGANGQTFGWSLTDSGGDRTVKLYADPGYNTVVVAQGTRTGNGSIVLLPKQDYTVSGSVTVAYSAADADGANTVTVSNFVATKDLQLSGVTQFDYVGTRGEIVKYTVDETVSAINTAINGDAGLLEARVTLTSSQILAMNTTPVTIVAAPGAGYYNEFVSGMASVDYGSAAYVTHDDIDIAYSSAPTVKCATADGVLAATADQITSFIKIAGVCIANNALVLTDVNGNPATGDSPVTVVITYRVVTL